MQPIFDIKSLSGWSNSYPTITHSANLGTQDERFTILLCGQFEQFGFCAYPYEFWHYSKGDAYDAILRGSREPARYGPIDFDPVTGRIWPLEDSATPLNSLDDIQNLIDNASGELFKDSH